MYYLQKICILIKNEEKRSAFEELQKRLMAESIGMEAEGIEVEIWQSADTGEQHHVGGGSLPVADTEETDIPRTLYIIDSGDLAQELLADGRAVLVWLHGGNRDQSFGGVKYAFEEPKELDAEYLERVYRRYADIPWDILETSRCYLRETIEEDVPAFYEIYKEPAITAYMEDLFEDPEEELAYTRDYREKVYEFYGFGIWTVIKKDTGEIIGRAGCTYREGFDEPELGFVIGVPWQRQGYAEEVCRAVLQYAKEYLGFEKMQAFVEPGNAASIRLCEKLGMMEIGRIGLHIRFMREL